MSNRDKHVLVLTRQDDEHADVVGDELQQRNASVLRLNQADYPETVSLSATSGGGRGGALKYQGTSFALSTISAVWRRRPTPYKAPAHLSAGEQRFIEEEARIGLNGILDTHCFCVSTSHALRAAENKPLQLARAQDCGLAIPRTLLTNDPDAVHAFYSMCREQVVIKPVVRGVVKEDEQNWLTMYTHRLSSEDLCTPAFEKIRATTHLFQEYIPKAYDLRVVVIGRHLFAVELHTPPHNVDFRTAYDTINYHTHHLPLELEQRIFRLVRSFGLQFASMDMIVTPEGKYIWLELNPNGQWYWLQHQLQQQHGEQLPLKETMADLLMNPEEHAL